MSSVRLGEAFSKLGFHLIVPRSDWTAAHENGVCVSLWQNEIHFNKDKKCSWICTQLHADPEEKFMKKPRHKRRTEHLIQAADKFDGKFSVVILTGNVGDPVGDKAEPQYSKIWKLEKLCRETGHFTAEMLR